jgi:hypothetical protein
MPIYGDEKRRQMARSTLPSTSRKGARDDLRNIKQKNRAQVRRNLRALIKGGVAPYVEENYDEASFDFESYPNHEINYAVRDRRDREKLGPALRWAPHQVAHLRREDRLSHMYTIMPDTLAGRHAVGHMDYLDEFRIEHPHRYVYRYSHMSEGRAEAGERDALLKPRLEEVIDINLLERFNEFSLWHRPHEITEEEYEGTKHLSNVFMREGPEWRYNRRRRHWWLDAGDVKFIDKGSHVSMPKFYKLVLEPLTLEKGSYMITEKRSDSNVNRYLRRSNGHWSVARALKECGV